MSYAHTTADCAEHHDVVRDYRADAMRPTITVCPDDTGTAPVCAGCGNREPNEWELGIGNYGVKPEGWVSPYVLWPCDDYRDLLEVYPKVTRP